MADETFHIALLRLDLYLPASRSLKDKRIIIKSLKDRLRSQFNISVSEFDDLDKWQKSGFVICRVGNDKRDCERSLRAVLDFIEKERSLQVLDHAIEFL